MCGIFGYITKLLSEGRLKELMRFAEKIRHRGPDNTNIEKILIDDNTLFIGHHRLSIIDLNQRSNQPMNSKDSRYKIIFNGEIYNHNDLRYELNSLYNISWIGTSDTETLLYLLIHEEIEDSTRRRWKWANVLLPSLIIVGLGMYRFKREKNNDCKR